MTEPGISKTQQLIFRSSYKKHRERLIDIRHNSTSNEFFMPPKPKPLNNGTNNQHSKTKKDEPESQNNRLQTLKGKSHGIVEPQSTNSHFKRSDKRNYLNYQQQRLQINSDLQNGESIKCFLPGTNKQSSNNQSTQTKIKHHQSYTTKYGSIDKTRRRSQHYQAPIPVQAFEQSTPIKQASADVYFNLPERNQNRRVLFRKTLILGNMQSCLIQICEISSRYLIVAYIMGFQSYTIRYYLSQKQSKELIEENNASYDQFCKKIVIEKLDKSHYEIKIKTKQTSPQNKKERAENQQSNDKRKHKIQNEFLKRNFYTLLKNEEENKKDVPKQTVQVDKQVINSLVARLAVPKRFFKYREETSYPETKKQSIEKLINTSNQKINLPKHLLPLKSHQSHRQSTKINKSLNSLKESKEKIVKAEESDKNVTKKVIIKQSNVKVKKQVEQEIVKIEDQYSQQFENPSSIIHQNKSIIKNTSQVLDKPIKAKNDEKKPEQQINQYEDEYQQEFDKDQMPQNRSNISKKAEGKAPAKEAVEDYEEEDYEQQFQNSPSDVKKEIDRKDKNKRVENRQPVSTSARQKQQNKIEESYQNDFSN